MDTDDLVELRRFAHFHEAELAISALDAAHIDAVLRDAGYGGNRPELSIASGGAVVMVRRSEAAAANTVLDTPVVAQATTVDSVTCANCGRALQGTVCPACDSEEEREIFLTPESTRATLGKVKLFVILAVVGLIVLPTIIDRMSRIDEHTWLLAFAAVGGLLLVVVLFKAFVSSNDERL